MYCSRELCVIGACFLTEEDVKEAQVRSQCRQSIVRLLLSTLDQPTPNLAHYLLGFELRKPVAKTTLQDPGELHYFL